LGCAKTEKIKVCFYGTQNRGMVDSPTSLMLLAKLAYAEINVYFWHLY